MKTPEKETEKTLMVRKSIEKWKWRKKMKNMKGKKEHMKVKRKWNKWHEKIDNIKVKKNMKKAKKLKRKNCTEKTVKKKLKRKQLHRKKKQK